MATVTHRNVYVHVKLPGLLLVFTEAEFDEVLRRTPDYDNLPHVLILGIRQVITLDEYERAQARGKRYLRAQSLHERAQKRQAEQEAQRLDWIE